MVGTPVPVKEMIKQVRFFARLLRNEHMHNYDDLKEVNMLQATQFFIDKKFMKLSEDKEYLTIQNEELFTLLKFSGDLI